MKKRKVLAYLFALSFLFTSCSSKPAASTSSDNSTNSAVSSDKQITLEFWRYDDDTESNSLDASIAAFEKENPNIKVNLTLVPNDQYEIKLRTAISGGNAPDLISIDGPTLASYASQNVLIPLDDYFAKDGDLQDISKGLVDSLTYNGKIYAAPNNDASLALYYNIKMFQEKNIPLPSQDPTKPMTWEQVTALAKQLNDPDKGIYGYNPAPWGFAGHEGAPFAEEPIIWQTGGDFLSPDLTTATGYLDSDKSKSALKWFQDLYNADGVAPKELPQDAFATGKIAMGIDGPWALATMAKNYPDFKLGVDYGVAPMPMDSVEVTPNGSWNMGITTNCKNPDAAWKFLNYITGVEGSKTWYQNTKNLPARASTVEAFPELNQYPMNIFVVQSQQFAHARPVTPAYPVISEAIRTLFEDVAINNSNIDNATANAVKKINAGIEAVNIIK